VRNCSSWRSPRSAWSAELIGQRLDLFVELLLLFGELSQHRGAVVGRDYRLPSDGLGCGIAIAIGAGERCRGFRSAGLAEAAQHGLLAIGAAGRVVCDVRLPVELILGDERTEITHDGGAILRRRWKSFVSIGYAASRVIQEIRQLIN
jgi:hypothetical protein